MIASESHIMGIPILSRICGSCGAADEGNTLVCGNIVNLDLNRRALKAVVFVCVRGKREVRREI